MKAEHESIACLRPITRKNALFKKKFYSIVSAAYKVFFIISCGLQSRGGYIFFFSLSKGHDDAHSFLGYVLLTKLPFRIVFPLFSITCLLRHRDFDEQKADVVVKHYYQGYE